MNRCIASTLALAAAALAGSAFADDITLDPAPVASTKTRADVVAELKKPGPNYWSSQYNMFQIKSDRTTEDLMAEYRANRREVAAVTGEDSGSAYFAQTAGQLRTGTATMGGPAR